MKKWAVLVGSVVAGLLIVFNVLTPGAGVSPLPEVPGPSIATQAPPTSSSTRPPKPEQTDAPADASTAILGVFNGTTSSGLADKVARKLGSSYNVQVVGNTLVEQPVTIVYYVKAKDQAAADTIGAAEFPAAEIAPLPKGTQVSVDGTTEKVSSDPAELQVVVFVGADEIKE